MRFFAFVLASLPLVAQADNWPQWRGPRHDGISHESGWLKNWAEGGEPRVAWRAHVGKGHSAISVGFGTLIAADNKLIVQAGRSGTVTIVETTPDRYRELRRMKVFSDDARETFTAPALANGRLYCRSYAGEVICLELAR